MVVPSLGPRTLDWLVAFSTFMAVSAHCKPERAFALAAYFSIVLSLAWNIGGQPWGRYNCLFRQVASVSSSSPGTIVSLTSGSWPSQTQGVACSYQPGLLASRPCLQQSGLHPAVTVAGIREVQLPKCKYCHVCFVCESQHLTRSCPLLTPVAKLSDCQGEPQSLS